MVIAPSKPIENIFDFAFFSDFYASLNALEKIAAPEKWTYSTSEGRKNTTNPILENYIHHTFKKLWNEYSSLTDEDEKMKVIYYDGTKACFNTGLFTENNNPIYALFRIARYADDKKPFSFCSFEQDSSNRLNDVYPLPRRANYFSDMRDLIYDYSLELRANSAHILDENIDRFPDDLVSNRRQLLVLFTGAVDLAKKRVQANYKVAVPTYYNNQICLMLPLCLHDTTTTDLALAVQRGKGFYVAKTCLTLDMAYNDARLIAKPDADWLIP